MARRERKHQPERTVKPLRDPRKVPEKAPAKKEPVKTPA